MVKKVMWYVVVIIALIGVITLSVGFYQAVTLTSGGRSRDITEINEKNNVNNIGIPKKPNILNITIMGDSIARGTGDEKGKGFAGYLPEDLKNKTPKDFSVENVGIEGQKIGQMLDQLQSGKLDKLLKSSDFVLVSIGGNDLRTVQNIEAATKDQSFNDLEDIYLSDLKETMKIIRKSNKDTLIIFLGLYNPYRLAGSFEDNRLVNLWNSDTEQLIESDDRAVFIPTYDLVKFNIKKYIAPDGLHPNSAGYQAISGRIAEAVESLLAS